MKSHIEIHSAGKWVKAAAIVSHGGHRATFEYLPEYVFGERPHPVSLALPPSMERLGFSEDGAPSCPVFLFDLVPQGPGRKYLLQQLGLPNTDDSDIPLAQYGACNPIGNLRLDTAVAYFADWEQKNLTPPVRGFAIEEIVGHSAEFIEHIWLYAMLAAGTTGVQGAAPKYLLTQDSNGLWFADAALPDHLAKKHWFVKRPRGRQAEDYSVLRNEAAYHAVAAACGLRAHGECFVRDNMLFFERFDRVVDNAQVRRLHQESLVSAVGIPGFPSGLSNFDFANGVVKYATNPDQELAEFIARDVLNQAMRNTDNHGRNTAMQILADGTVRLTPIYDFAPMYLDPEGIPRNSRWLKDGKEITGLNNLLAHIHTTDAVRHSVLKALRPFAQKLQKLTNIMAECGVDKEIINACDATTAGQLAVLAGLR